MTNAPVQDPAAVQRRTLRLLFVTQIISGIGVAIGASVGALLAADLVGVGLSGLAQSAVVVGAALAAIPAAAIVHRAGRRPSLAACYFAAAGGSALVVLAAVHASIPLLFLGYFLFGGGTAAGFQARYAAVDLAPVALRGRHLSLIVWATTLGAVAGPNLAAVAGRALAGYGVPTLASPFVFSGAVFIVAAALLLAMLRPDPAVVARTRSGGEDAGAKSLEPPSIAAGWRAVTARPAAILGVSAMAVGHVVMVAVMAMTPVHIRGAGHDAALTLKIVGIVISVHIAGMYAFSPVMGWLTDRVGRRAVIGLGVGLLLLACTLAGTSGMSHPQLALGLGVLGLGWSATMVAGSTLLSDAIAMELRPAAQGLSDLIMGLAAASAGALSGAIVHARGYGTLALVAALATIPLMLLLGMGPKAAKRAATAAMAGVLLLLPRLAAAQTTTPHVIKWYEAGGATAGVLALMLLDEPVQRFAQRSRSATSDDIAAVVRRMGQPEVYVTTSLGLIAAGLIANDSHVTKAGARAATSVALAAAVELSLKAIIGRARPDSGLGAFHFDAFSGKAVSLPSGHSALSFALATSLAGEVRSTWARVGLYGLATATALSRVNDDRHWLSDIAAGSLIGFTAAKLVGGKWQVFGVKPPRWLVNADRATVFSVSFAF